MDLHQLEVLTAVADEGSFSAAADALDTVQSNVSAHVARLERELGVVLVDRGAHRLTEDGEAVVARARRVAAEIAGVRSDLAALRNDVVGTVRIGLIGTTARWLLPLLIERAAGQHPKVHLEAVEGTSNSLEPQLAAGLLDLAVLNLPVTSSEVLFTPLFEEDLVLVVSADDPLASRGELELAELAPLKLLLPLAGTALRHEIDSALGPAGITPKLRAEVDGVRLLASLTFEGLGPSILPATAIPAFMRDRWCLVRVAGLPRRRVGVARRKRGMPSSAAKAVTVLMSEIMSQPETHPAGLYAAPMSGASAAGPEIS